MSVNKTTITKKIDRTECKKIETEDGIQMKFKLKQMDQWYEFPDILRVLARTEFKEQ